jgi:hypothetical protein
MADKPKKLSDTARALLTVAATRGDHLIRPPKLPIVAARQVVRSLLNAGLVEEVPARVNDAGYAWRTGEDGEVLMLRATALGLARVGEGETGIPTPEPIAAETWEPTGADASTAVAGLAPLVTDPAAYGSQQGQGGPEDANCREEADNATPRWERPLRPPSGQSQPRPLRLGGVHDAAPSSRPPRPCSTPGTHALAVTATPPTR